MAMLPLRSLLGLLSVYGALGIIRVRHSQPHDGGFCSLKSSGLFPLSPPAPHVPWIWDATVTRSGRMVETTAISRNACRFDQKLWRKIVEAYPQYAEQLGGGLISNIYAPVVPGYDYVRVNANNGYKGERKKGLQMRTVVCVFLLRDKIVARESSLRILDVEIAELSSLQIRCPIPENLLQLSQDGSAMWDNMRIERRLSPHPEHQESHLPNSTESFSVCNMHRLEMAQTNTDCALSNKSSCPGKQNLRRNVQLPLSEPKSTSLTSQYLYKLSLCTATSRSSRSHLVEWIEYHKLLGVEHFYIYDTNHRDVPVESTLGVILADYVHMGLLTIVRWPYQNCVKNMGSGRRIVVTQPFWGEFMPPRAISQTAALASCYSRHKEFSEWMIHIDDDEFLGFSPTAKFGGVKVENLYELVSQITKKDPRTNAVSFYPLCVTDCSDYDTNTEGDNSSPRRVLPRYGRWNKGKFCPYYETKLVMRTAAIGMFFTHYITLRELPPPESPFSHYNREPTQLQRREAAVLHYKNIHDLDASGSIFGASLPIQPNLKSRECKIVPEMKENTTAAFVLDSLTKLALPYVERNFISQLTEIYAFEV